MLLIQSNIVIKERELGAIKMQSPFNKYHEPVNMEGKNVKKGND